MSGTPRLPAILFFVMVILAAPPASPNAEAGSGREIRFMGRRIMTPGSDAQRAWVDRVHAIMARLAGQGATRSDPRLDDGPGERLNAWIGGGVPVCPASIAEISPTIAPDFGGGSYIAWLDFRNGIPSGYPDVYATRLDGNGDYAAGFNSTGLAVALRDSLAINPVAEPDGSAGAYVAFTEYYSNQTHYKDIYLQRVVPGGTIGPGWPTNGKKLNLGDNDGFSIRADGQGGLFVGWIDPVNQGWIIRLDSSGNPVTGWGSGIAVANASITDSDFSADGTGGFYVAWTSNDSVLCTRYAANGTVAAGWTAAGKVVEMGGFVAQNTSIATLTSGDVMVGWSDFRTFDLDNYAVRVGSGGAFPSPWTINGIPVCTATGATGTSGAVSDNAGGAVFVWEDYRDVNNPQFFAQRVTSTGGIAGSWPLDGAPICAARPNKFLSSMISDGAGGVLAAWDDDVVTANDYDIYAQHLLFDSSRPVLFPSAGLLVSGETYDQISATMATDAASGAILAWEDDRGILVGPQIYAARLLADGTVSAQAALADASASPDAIRLHWYSPDGARFAATLERDAGGSGFVRIASLRADGTGHVRYEDRDVVAGDTYRYRLVVEEGACRTILGEVSLRVPAALALALEPSRPNPSAGPLTLAFVLPTDAPAQLEVLDVAGRRVLSRDVGGTGAGRHLLRLDETLAPGVYVVRLSQQGSAVSGRVVRTE